MANDRSPWPSVRFTSAGMRTAAARLTHLSVSGYAAVATGCMRLLMLLQHTLKMHLAAARYSTNKQ